MNKFNIRRLRFQQSSASPDRDRKGPYSPSLPHHRAYGSVHGGSDSYALLSKAGLWVQHSAKRDSVPSPAVAGASPRLSAEKSSSNCVFCRLSRMSKRFLLTTLSVQAFIQSLPVLRVLTVSPLSGECRNRADRLHWLVGSEEARSVVLTLTSVRRSNCTCGSPACSFHKGSFFRDAIDGINLIRFTNPYSPYSFSSGSVFQPVFRHRL